MIDGLEGLDLDDLFDSLGVDTEDLDLDADSVEALVGDETEHLEVLEPAEFHDVLEAIARSTNDLDDVGATIAEIDDYVANVAAGPEELEGVINNIKGIHGEIEVRDLLNAQNDGLEYRLAELTNNPGVDIYGYDADGTIVRRLQVKMTENPDYIRKSLANLPAGVELVSGTEMATAFPGQILDLGVSSTEVAADVEAALTILRTEEPLFTQLAASEPFASYIAKRGIAFA